MAPKRIPLEERFWSKVAKAGPDDCWLWTGAKSVRRPGRSEDDRYGQLWNPDGPPLKAHRVAWELQVGPIPDGLTIDHLWEKCQSRLCQNARHLEPVTAEENTRRQWDKRGRSVTCPKGHDEWRVKRNGRRDCAACHRERERARRTAS